MCSYFIDGDYRENFANVVPSIKVPNVVPSSVPSSKVQIPVPIGCLPSNFSTYAQKMPSKVHDLSKNPSMENIITIKAQETLKCFPTSALEKMENEQRKLQNQLEQEQHRFNILQGDRDKFYQLYDKAMTEKDDYNDKLKQLSNFKNEACRMIPHMEKYVGAMSGIISPRNLDPIKTFCKNPNF